MTWVILPEDIAKAWRDYDPDSYAECLMDEDESGLWFDLMNGPAWMFDPIDGPFYYEPDIQTIYSVDLRPSHKGEFIPTYVGDE